MREYPMEGGCTCGQVRYRIHDSPIFIHCCHCRWCQRETGSAFVLNGMLEADALSLEKGQVEVIDTPSNSGKGQQISRCPVCRVALWSNYASAREAIHFLRIGTLDNPDAFAPDIHIFTSSRQPWFELPDDTPAVAEYYRRSDYWPAQSIERYNRAIGR